jgi:large subunit ribosomal protein L1
LESLLSVKMIIGSGARTTRQLVKTTNRGYISRAHPPKTSPIGVPVVKALDNLMEGIQQRREKREAKWNRNADVRRAKGIKEQGAYWNVDETVELALNLNLDPRKPGQALRGTMALPHGTGKVVKALVFVDDEDDIEKLNAPKGTTIGGPSLIEGIMDGTASLDGYDRAYATPEAMSRLGKAARLLGPKGLYPNAKTGSIVPLDKLPDVLSSLNSIVTYRTDKQGIVHAGIGKGSFSSDALLDNIRTFMNGIQEVKPTEGHGKGKKASTKAKYYLSAFLASSQGPSQKVDLRSLDPTSTFFMATPS